MVSPGSNPWPSARTHVQVPAHPDFVASVRAMTRSMAILADVSFDDVEELQMAVDEAAILLLPLVDEAGEATLSADFEVGSGCVAVVVSVAGRPGVTVDRTGLPWVMLSAIDPEAEVRSDDGVLAIAISRRREELRR